MMRAFIAIDPPPEIKSRITVLVKELDDGSRNIRWCRSHGMHLTLKFLGEITPQLAEKTTDIIKQLSHRAPFHIHFKGTGVFPDSSRPRVLWLGVEGGKPLSDLVAEMELLLNQIGFPKETRKYHPHITLGRVKTSSRISSVLEDLTRYREENFGSMSISHISLYKSILKPSGAEYSVINKVNFS